jgi:hypothetical protein
MYLVGTVPLPDEPSLALADARGLAIVQHHFNLLGLDTFRFPLPSDQWDWDGHPGLLANMWQGCVAAQAQWEVVWSVGLRGLNDYAYPCPNPQQCGRVLSEAMANQTAWIRAVQPNATIITYMWDEALQYLEDGYLTIPAGVQIVFTDAGAGFIRGDPAVFAKYSHG